MKKYVNSFLTSPLVSGSLVIFLGSQLTNFLQFLFHFFMSRQLTHVADYGDLATVLSTITLFSLVSAAITPTIVNFASVYFVKNDISAVEYIFKVFIKITSSIGVLTFFIALIFAKQITSYLQLSNSLYIIGTGLIIALNLLLVVGTALLQARLKFTYIAVSNFISALFKVVGSIIIVSLGFALNGVIGALILTSIISILTVYYPLKDVVFHKSHSIAINTKDIMSYAIPSALATLFLTGFTSVDLFLVKHFFSPDTAGEYAGIMLIGKIIYFFSYPIGLVMFPLITRRYANNESIHDIFLQALGLVLIPAIGLTFLYFVFPSFIITLLLHKSEYASLSNILGYVGIFITIFSFLSIVTNFFLSVRKTGIWFILALGVVVQTIGISFLHQSLYQVVTISIMSELLCLLVLGGYYLYSIKSK